MARVSVAQASALGLEDGVEAGNEHVGRDASHQRLVDPLKYLPWRGGIQGLSYRPEHRTGCTHGQSRWHALTGSVPYGYSHPPLSEVEEVVEVPSHLPGRLVVGGDLPSLQ